MEGFWPRSSVFAFLWTETESRSINTPKKNEANTQPSRPYAKSITHKDDSKKLLVENSKKRKTELPCNSILRLSSFLSIIPSLWHDFTHHNLLALVAVDSKRLFESDVLVDVKAKFLIHIRIVVFQSDSVLF